jgi:hypothetical protein
LFKHVRGNTLGESQDRCEDGNHSLSLVGHEGVGLESIRVQREEEGKGVGDSEGLEGIKASAAQLEHRAGNSSSERVEGKQVIGDKVSKL